MAVGGFIYSEPEFVSRLPSRRDWDAPAWKKALEGLFREAGVSPADAQGCVLSSVVPELTEFVKGALVDLTGRSVMAVGPELDTGLDLGEYSPHALGSDRVVDAVSALARYTPPLAIFDLGTATTLSVLDREGRFAGGMILPGMALSAQALSARASQLPPISLEAPETMLGTDTLSCMQSGIIYGTAAQIDGISNRVEVLLGEPVTTVLTGGLSRLVLPYCQGMPYYEEHLLLKGLHLLWQRNT